MPIHDWSRVYPTIYHHFHQRWTTAIADELNRGLLPDGYSALLEQHAAGLVPDVLTLERRRNRPLPQGGTAIATAPTTRLTIESASDTQLRRANRVTIRHRLGDVIGIIELVSPGNKSSRTAIAAFVGKTIEYLQCGVHVLLIDPFPPTARDPQSLHKLIWDDFEEVPFKMPPDEPLLLASYRSGASELRGPTAYLEPFRIGSELPDMPAWLDADSYVPVPLERSYSVAWKTCPSDYRHFVEHGTLPEK